MPNKRQYASDKGWVQMTENFLETAPQTTILIYIILKTFNTGVIVDICFRSRYIQSKLSVYLLFI